MAFYTLARDAHLFPVGQDVRRGFFFIHVDAVQLLPRQRGKPQEVRVWYTFTEET